MAKIGVVGTGTWGTTLAIMMARQGHHVSLVARTEREATQLGASRENIRYLPGVPFPAGMTTTTAGVKAFGSADLVFIAVPSRTLRDNICNIREFLHGSPLIISCTKGLEYKTGKRMSEVLEEELPTSCHVGICALGGPSLAKEIIEGKPAVTVVASKKPCSAKSAQEIMNSRNFRVYTSDDIIGVEFGGALKNIIALGAGVCDGLALGDNAKAGFMSRGLAEMGRLSAAAGANPLTFAGLSGMGDLIATCSSSMSRNHYFGEQLGKGKTVEEIQGLMNNVAEGVDTTTAVIKLAEKLGVEMPITQATHKVLFEDMRASDVMTQLLDREANFERLDNGV